MRFIRDHRLAVLTVDLAGWGSLVPHRRGRYGLRRNFKGIEESLYIEEFYAAAYLLAAGDNLPGLRTREIRAAITALIRQLRMDRSTASRETALPLGVLGQGRESAYYAMAVGALDDRVQAVLALDGAPSLLGLLKTSQFPPTGLVAPGSLQLMDAPQLKALVSPKPLIWLPRHEQQQTSSTSLSGGWPEAVSRWVRLWMSDKKVASSP
jgi:hypothetical protein